MSDLVARLDALLAKMAAVATDAESYQGTTYIAAMSPEVGASALRCCAVLNTYYPTQEQRNAARAEALTALNAALEADDG